MIPCLFLIGEYLTIKEIDNCIQVSKGFCQEFVNSINIKKKRNKSVINNQRVLINTCLLQLKNSLHPIFDDDFKNRIDEILIEFRKEGYQKYDRRQNYIELFEIKNHDDLKNYFIRYEILLEKINANIPCLIY